jgi:hypothetical protein
MELLPLILFNEKVDRLERCRLIQRLKDPQFVLQPERVLHREWIAFDNVTEDDVDAFVLNARLLMQDRDGFSIRCLAKIYENPALPTELRDEFKSHRRRFSNHKNSPSLLKTGERRYTHGEIFDIIFYGGLAHQDMKYYKEYLLLTKMGATSALAVFPSFIQTVQCFLSVVRKIIVLNQRVLELNQSNNSVNTD